MTTHELTTAKTQRELGDELWKAGVTIVVGLLGGVHGPVEVATLLVANAAAVAALRARLDADQFAAAFDRFWAERASRFRPAFEHGIEPAALRGMLWRWAVDGRLPDALQEPHGPATRRLRAVAAPD